MHAPGINGPSVNESSCEIFVCNVAVFDISEWNRKETMTCGADQFEMVLGIFNLLQVVSDSRDDYDSRAVFLITTSACSGLRDTHTGHFNHQRFCDTIEMFKSTGETIALRVRLRSEAQLMM